MGLALHNYHDVHGRFPPAVVYGYDGQPLYSWRVLILPFIEQEELYNQFHRDEPWDSPHNRALLERMPSTYAPPRYRASLAPPGHTFVHVFVGPDTAFGDCQGQKSKDFCDGTSNTILVVEGGEAVPWTKPQDIPLEPDLAMPELATVFKDIVRVGMADGSVHHLPLNTDPAKRRAMITRNGGEKVFWD